LVEGRTDFTAIEAVADVTVDQTRLLEWLRVLVRDKDQDYSKCKVRNMIPHGNENMIPLTRTNCTAPQKQVVVASSSVDHPSFERWTTGKPLSSKVLIFQVVSRFSWLRLIWRCEETNL
jgi:hypothetical protein